MIIVILCILTLSLLLTWIEKYDTTRKNLIDHLLIALKIKDKLHFIILNYTPNYTLHSKIWILIKLTKNLMLECKV